MAKEQTLLTIDDILDDDSILDVATENAGPKFYKPRGRKKVKDASDYTDKELEELAAKEERKRKRNEKRQNTLLGQEKSSGKKSDDDNKLKLAANSIMALNTSANNALKTYISKSPKYIVIKQQLIVLKEKAIEYKNGGNIEAFEYCMQQVKELIDTKKKFENIAKEKTKVQIDEQNENIKNSEVLKDLKVERIELEAEYSNLNPLSIVTKIQNLRKRLKFKEDVFDEYIDDSNDNEDDNVIDIDSEDIDSIIDNEVKNKTLKDTYWELCDRIEELTGIDAVQINTMSPNKILNLLKENLTEEDYNRIDELKSSLQINKMESSSEIKRLKGYNDITDIIFDIFDFQSGNEEISQYTESHSKNMLAASNVPYVEKIAYNVCSKLNMLHYFPDAVSYGLVGLSLAINKWYSIQKLKDRALSFEGFAHMYIINTMRRGLYQLSSGGMISASVWATNEHYKNKNYEFWVNNNKELKDLPKQMIEDLISGTESETGPNTMTESAFKSMVGGEDGDDADIWANAIADKGDANSYAENKMEYENLVKSLKSLFNMFDYKIDNQTGIKKITDKKIFNKYDYRLFLLEFGLMTKFDPETGKDRPYTQPEIAEELRLYYAADGIKKTFTQPAISDRRKKLLEKIKRIMDENPSIKQGFEYLMYYMSANRNDMKVISDSREELGISYEMNNNLKTEEEEFQESVNNSKRMSDMLDDENDIDVSSAFEN